MWAGKSLCGFKTIPFTLAFLIFGLKFLKMLSSLVDIEMTCSSRAKELPQKMRNRFTSGLISLLVLSLEFAQCVCSVLPIDSVGQVIFFPQFSPINMFVY